MTFLFLNSVVKKCDLINGCFLPKKSSFLIVDDEYFFFFATKNEKFKCHTMLTRCWSYQYQCCPVTMMMFGRRMKKKTRSKFCWSSNDSNRHFFFFQINRIDIVFLFDLRKLCLIYKKKQGRKIENQWLKSLSGQR